MCARRININDVTGDNPLGGVLSYTTEGIQGVCGQTVGANGAGDYSVLLLGSPEEAGHAARAYLQELERNRHKITNVMLTLHGDDFGYHGSPVSALDCRADGAHEAD